MGGCRIQARRRQARLVLAAILALLVSGVAAPPGVRTVVAEPDTVWTSGGRPNAVARDALALLRASENEGLRPDDYDASALTHLARWLGTAPAAADAAAFDARLTAAMADYLRHLHQGRVDPKAIGFRLVVPADQHDFRRLVRDAAAAGRLTALVDSFRPAAAQYDALRTVLWRYRSLDEPSDPLPPVRRSVHPGELYEAAHDLRRRLRVFGDLSGASAAGDTGASGVYDAGLAQAVRRFQARHGLEADGVLGKQTVTALNVPVRWRRRQIELALERVRWLPHITRPRVLVLNIPMFEVWGWRAGLDGAPTFTSPAIVGRALRTATPVMADEMREVIFRPYWNVPHSILRHEILPLVERDPAYLEREEMEVVAGDGDDALVIDPSADALARLARGEVRLRQRPGPRNALGLVKFVFPNDDNVYMHDTPARTLFDRSRRDFSHGCVRVLDAIGLAEWVLADQGGWPRARIVAAMDAPATLRVRLATPVQVLLFYTTAAVLPDGNVRFADDIYGYDRPLDRALAAMRESRADPATNGA